YQLKPEVWLTPLKPEEASLIKQGMVEAVDGGTASGLSIAGVQVAAKTGSAELGYKPAHGWFVAFAPANDPIIAVAVLIEHGGTGSGSAGPIAKEIILAALGERR
ncbi:MAG TPA: penicillin-binding transpeptidase domain-containing protein, partial [Verrucomicrobiae bacterium]|nr:penicillin-binding transpeptidase domain-containing protein [Verrucomicrobiae bacterium]